MPSIIGADLKVVGNLSCDSDIEIHGAVEGNVEAKTVTVDKDARVDGSIRAQSVIVSGGVDGKMEASEISLTSTSQVTGELLHEVLSVEPGARLEARLSLTSKERRIAAQIPKPKLDISEPDAAKDTSGAPAPAAAKADEPKAGEAKAGETEPDAAKSAESSSSDDGGDAGAGEPRSSSIPEVFDRRKKQATG
jgi:cytoskeletal protein CcmA (bactofilin family)